MKGFATAATLLASASSAVALGQLKIHNWMSQPIYLHLGSNPVATIAPGAIYPHSYIPGGASTSLKLGPASDNSQLSTNVLQFEYTLTSSSLWYDLSDLNGTPYKGQNVKVTPTGSGSNAANCVVAKCPANTVCKGPNAYSFPDDNTATHTCPLTIGDMWLDIGEPNGQFKARTADFTA